MGRVDGKIALVTGAAMGIGRACAEVLAREGASVLLTDLEDAAGQAAVADLTAEGAKVSYQHQDVTSEDAWVDIIGRLRDDLGGLDILVNNAGIAIAGSLFDMTLEDFRKQNAVNLEGVFLGLKHAIPLMHASGGGSVINLSSVAGLKASPNLSAYAMTKGGVRLLSKSAALECASAGMRVRVNSVHPGLIATAIWDKMGRLDPGTNENRVEVNTLAERVVPGGKLGQPQDIANMVLFLASDESAYVNGAELVVDHGFSA